MEYMLLIMEPAGQRHERGEAAGRQLHERMLRFGRRAPLARRARVESVAAFRRRRRSRAGARRPIDAHRRSVRRSEGDGRRVLPARLRHARAGDRGRARMSRSRVGHRRGARIRSVLHLIRADARTWPARSRSIGRSRRCGAWSRRASSPASLAFCVTSGSPKSSRRTRWSRRWNNGRSMACPIVPPRG